MKKILKYRWIVLIIWIITTVVFAVNQPDLKQIINQKGEATISDSEPSKIASQMLNKIGDSKGDTLILVFNDEEKITKEKLNAIEEGINNLKNNQETLGITKIIDPFGTPEAKDQLISEDDTTLIAQVFVEKGTRDTQTILNDFENIMKEVQVNNYITGSLAINNDYSNDVSEGVNKSGIITIVFILVVLVLMFRSVVTPVVSLVAVGISYLCSMGIIGILVDYFNFPVTSFTQMFVILVLFGIGTDYHILLFNRFKEELAHGSSVEKAILESYKTSGKTIIYSGLIVFIAFASLSFVKFSVYKSANAVAIGIAVLMIEIMTFTPLMMKILGNKLFWPSKNKEGHKESKIWGKAASTSVKHPVLSLLIVALLITPVILFNTTQLSFDSMKDLSVNDSSIKGFNIVADKFGAGKVMQTTIVIENKNAMDNNENLAILDQLTEKLKGIEGIEGVAGPTQPKGEMIEALYTNSQTSTVVEGLNDANDGVQKVKDGIDTMKNSLSTPDFSKVENLITGTDELQNGMMDISTGLIKINEGIEQGVSGADSLITGIEQLKTGVDNINNGLNTISGKITEINKGYTTLGKGYKSMPASIEQLKQLVAMMESSVANIEIKLPNDTDVETLKSELNNLSDALDSINSAIDTANTNYELLTTGLSQVNEGLKTVIASTNAESELVVGINALENGAITLSDGLKKGSAGQEQVIASMAELKEGAEKIESGQSDLYIGLQSFGSGMTQLTDGLNKSSDGLSAVSTGIAKSSDFLNQLTTTKTFYIPEEVFDNEDITKMFDMYMSEDRNVAKLTVTLNSEPYSENAINLIEDIKSTVSNELKGTDLAEASIGVAGATAGSYDLKNIATHDIIFTQIIVLTAIFILLIILLRSFWTPLFIIGSLVVAYYSALSATSVISKMLFSSAQDGLSWNVPFFAFVMIAALGVDYSIFLMTRYKEYPQLMPKEAIVMAARNIGGVVMSAAIILAGTFATMYPSNIVVLMELAICVIIGLFLLAFILLPIVIPALISLKEGSFKGKI